MNEQNDKPIGAPNLNAEDPQTDSNPEQKPPTQKRKLNWKAFGFGIIAVILIEFFAISMLQSGDPQIPIEPTHSTPTPTQTTIPKPTVFQTECTDEAMQCPDGSFVGRSGPKCEFVCPK